MGSADFWGIQKINQKNKPRRHQPCQQEKDRSQGEKKFQGPIEKEHRQHGESGAKQVLRNRAEKAGGPGLRVYANLDRKDPQTAVAGLDQSLHAVGKPAVKKKPQTGLPGVGTKPGGSVPHRGLGKDPESPTANALQKLFDPGKFRMIGDRAAAHHQIRLFLQDGRDQKRDILTTILVIGISVDHDIRPRLKDSSSPL